MAAATGMRKSTCISDYPEHLNPFREEDNHSKLRFWTLTRKPGKRNSFSLNNIKDFRNTWSLKSFMKKSKKGQVSQNDSKSTTPVSGESSPVVYRRAIQYGSSAADCGMRTSSSERYVYGGSVTPLPRSRFQERLRTNPPPVTGAPANHFTHLAPGRASFSHRAAQPYALPGLARGEAGGSRLSNPFGEDGPIVPARRNKKRAPLPPSPLNTTTASNENSHSAVGGLECETTNKEDDVPTNDPSFKIELRIVEEIDNKPIQTLETKAVTTSVTEVNNVDTHNNELQQASKVETPSDVSEVTVDKNGNENIIKTVATDALNNTVHNNDSGSTSHSPVEIRNTIQELTDSDNKDVVFEKIDIRLYRRNSSFNSDSINMQNGKTELSPNNRCKSMSNNVNSTVTSYEVPLHIDEDNNEINDVHDNQSAPQKVVCKILNTDKLRKTSIDNSILSTEREFREIDWATRELEREISGLNSYNDDIPIARKTNRNSVSDIKSRFENTVMYSPNPIPKPRRSRAGSESPVHL